MGDRADESAAVALAASAEQTSVGDASAADNDRSRNEGGEPTERRVRRRTAKTERRRMSASASHMEST